MPTYYDIEVSLSSWMPLTWRRFYLRAERTSFADLHRAIQDACGWLDYHLYRFSEATPSGMQGLAQSDIELDWDIDNSPAGKDAPLAPWVGKHTPRACKYTYDFGDDWDHDVVVRDIVHSEERFFRRLIDGQFSFPPEDCGGLPGFSRVHHFVQGGRDLDDDLAEWLGDWAIEADIAQVREAFDTNRKPRNRQ